MSYTIRTIPPPEMITVNGLNGPEVRPAPDSWVKPQSYVRLIYTEGNTQLWDDTSGTAIWADVIAACPGLQAWKDAQLRAKGNEILEKIASPYQPSERETWPYQREECQAYYRDNMASTPFCDTIAEARGIPRGLFLEKVKENMDLFSSVSAQILGVQQALLDAIWSASSVAEVINVQWPEEIC